MTIDANTRPIAQLTARVTTVHTNGRPHLGQSLKSIIGLSFAVARSANSTMAIGSWGTSHREYLDVLV